MPGTASETPEKRVPLSRDRVLCGAVAIADAAGIGSLTMRSLAQELGVKPMALYYHVANKEEILDGVVDLVFSEIELPASDGDWRSEIVQRANSGLASVETPPLGHRAPGISEDARPGNAATPRRDHRHPAGGQLLGGDDSRVCRPSVAAGPTKTHSEPKSSFSRRRTGSGSPAR
jgi:AcrR family transcriptional regulator